MRRQGGILRGMLIRHAGELWRSPESETFDDEAALELLLKDSPNLLPGTQGAPVAVVSQLQVPGTGPADLVAVSTDGGITLVECKLRANPEIRRHVLGQVFAYASGLWHLSYEEFDAAYSKRAGMTLLEHVREAARHNSADFDEDSFVEAIEQALSTGHFSLVIAVDKITDELRKTIEFVNSHTEDSLNLLGMQLAYVKDGDVEILVPSTYGAEAAEEKAWSAGRSQRAVPWTLDEVCADILRDTPDRTGVLRQLTQWAAGNPHVTVHGGGGASPGVMFAIDAGRPGAWRNTMLTLASDRGRVLEVRMRSLVAWPPFTEPPQQQNFLSQLNELGIAQLQGVSPERNIRQRIPLADLGEGQLVSLLAVLDEWITTVRQELDAY